MLMTRKQSGVQMPTSEGQKRAGRASNRQKWSSWSRPAASPVLQRLWNQTNPRHQSNWI